MAESKRRPNPPLFVIGLLVAAVVGMAIILVIVALVVNPRSSSTENKVVATQEQILASSLASCQRGNDSRHQLLLLYQALAAGNRRRARAAGTLRNYPLPPPIRHYLSVDSHASRLEARRVATLAARFVDANRSVSAHPDARNIFKRAVIDCRGKYLHSR